MKIIQNDEQYLVIEDAWEGTLSLNKKYLLDEVMDLIFIIAEGCENEKDRELANQLFGAWGELHKLFAEYKYRKQDGQLHGMKFTALPTMIKRMKNT